MGIMPGRLLLLKLFSLFTITVTAQTSPTYKMEAVRAVQYFSENVNHMYVIVKVTPLIQDFKLIVSTKTTCDFGKGSPEIVLTEQSPNKANITVYGNDIDEKGRMIYELIQDRINLKAEGNIYFLVFYFNNLTEGKVENLNFKYGLWESNNTDLRYETTYNLKVDQQI